jgi:hypothetical protein
MKQLKHLEHTLATYVYSHCNIYNIQRKHLHHTFETAKTFEIYTYTCIAIATYATPDLLLKHPDKIYAIYF